MQQIEATPMKNGDDVESNMMDSERSQLNVGFQSKSLKKSNFAPYKKGASLEEESKVLSPVPIRKNTD